MKPLLVGELNPYGTDPRYALYPLPKYASGHRLCKNVMQLEMIEYLRKFDRVNLCVGKWSKPAAQCRAFELMMTSEPRAIVLLGSKVCAAFGYEYAPFTRSAFMFANGPHRGQQHAIVILPHPSALCRLWNASGSFERARNVLVEAGVLS